MRRISTKEIDFLKNYYLDHVTISDDRGPLSIEFKAHDLLNVEGGYLRLPFDLGGLDGVPRP